jgi:hypothetical protein
MDGFYRHIGTYDLEDPDRLFAQVVGGEQLAFIVFASWNLDGIRRVIPPGTLTFGPGL